ncbi:GNAT family N-acetyltransferase [Microbispora sp. RL4-1S]|uniref:GNAT family N-acetyltransferase n=1 Tax=Microbispora oryzae TaxID=2806554 RepID=A0A940WQJ8_9ACTN|nr:GNAT family N-acetyltransferase [Microbispora oryzae]MBP2707448.1 GNAT family N-acetyltransferase [Microbispora oryzae]
MTTVDPWGVPAERVPVRRLGPEDVPACLALADDRGWSREERKWLLLLEIGEGYGVDDPSGGLAGTVVLTRYGTTAAAIGMMLVASRFGGRGLGRRLMGHALTRAGDAAVFLWATKFGRPLYEKLGFEAAGTYEARVGRFSAGPRVGASRPADRERDLAALLTLDAEVFGADRSGVVARLFAFAERVRVIEDGGRIRGYAAAWRNGETVVVGPVVADDDAVAKALIEDLAREEDGPIRLDLDQERRPELISWLADRGVPQAHTTEFMVYGGPLHADRSRLVAPFTVAMG